MYWLPASRCWAANAKQGTASSLGQAELRLIEHCLRQLARGTGIARLFPRTQGNRWCGDRRFINGDSSRAVAGVAKQKARWLVL